ncbi:single-stranded DNA-binding protein [Macrococcus equipercicus]|uniref:Single-stranded DNA-binding protein n=1 Tax=Macrococcus equipercicus TaxID=69967 RepID=A0A9Q9BWN8_9STAP|nr:single-stranded DNA-binding protein [Macrococcus equipercicus]UTH14747.1 single-stranded DNA-binding protein [Macrococcus equipercicus]
MNSCKFIGRITRDLEFRVTPSGTELVSFDIAVQRSFKNNDGEYESDFIRCVAFKKTADFINNYAKKGYVMAVDGEMRNNNYEDNNGVKHYGMQLIINNVDTTVLFLNKKNNQDSEVSTAGYDYGTTKQSQGQNTSPAVSTASNPFANGGPLTDDDLDDLPF